MVKSLYDVWVWNNEQSELRVVQSTKFGIVCKFDIPLNCLAGLYFDKFY